MTKTLCVLTLFTVALANLAQAQAGANAVVGKEDPVKHQAALEAKKQFVGAVSPDATTACSFTFSGGTGNKFLKFCVTKNGNITQFQSPAGVEYVNVAPAGEGYAFCDFDSATQYFDYAGYGDSGNWGAPTTVSSTATSVKIARTTSNGLYTLTQTITYNAGSSLAQISMIIKNNSTTTAHHIGILRYADVDADGFTSNSFDYTGRTAFGYNQMQHGLQLQYVSGPSFNGGFSQLIPGGPNPCQIFTHVVGPLSDTDGSIFAQFDLQLAKKASQTVVVAYKSF
jgi:hypothetical protein